MWALGAHMVLNVKYKSPRNAGALKSKYFNIFLGS